MRGIISQDISKPLKNSFIHTGHGSPFGKSWGSPAIIDEVYLNNPMDPPDLIGIKCETHFTPRLQDRKTSLKCEGNMFNLHFLFNGVRNFLTFCLILRCDLLF